MAKLSICLFFDADLSEEQIQDCCNILDEHLATQGFDININVSVGSDEMPGLSRLDYCSCGHRREGHHIWGKCHGIRCKCTGFVLCEEKV